MDKTIWSDLIALVAYSDAEPVVEKGQPIAIWGRSRQPQLATSP